jgi:four helix bundle protein
VGLGLGLRMEDRAGLGAGLGAGDVAVARGPGVFEHERLHVYRFAREFFGMVVGWRKREMPAEVKKQIVGSSASILSNIAEGAGKTSKADKRRFYEIAKGSATEAAAQLDILRMLELIDASEHASARDQLLRVVKMLSGLCGAPRTTER